MSSRKVSIEFCLFFFSHPAVKPIKVFSLFTLICFTHKELGKGETGELNTGVHVSRKNE